MFYTQLASEPMYYITLSQVMGLMFQKQFRG